MPESREQNSKLHRERVWGVQLKPYYNGRGEAEVVPGYQLAKVLQEWTVRYLRAHSEEQVGRTGPVQFLAEHTGIPIRRVSGFCNGEFQVVSLTQAEKLLMSIDREYMLTTGEIQVVPNPNWSLEKWLEYMQERGCI